MVIYDASINTFWPVFIYLCVWSVFYLFACMVCVLFICMHGLCFIYLRAWSVFYLFACMVCVLFICMHGVCFIYLRVWSVFYLFACMVCVLCICVYGLYLQDHDGHGPEFLKHMHRINSSTGAHLSVSFYDTF